MWWGSAGEGGGGGRRRIVGSGRGAWWEVDAGYKPPVMRDVEWTYVEKGLVRPGFRGVEARAQSYGWRGEGVEEALGGCFEGEEEGVGGGGLAGWRGDGGWRRLEPLGYFFEAGNLEVEKERRSWMEEVGPGMERRLGEDFGYRDGSLEGPVVVTLAVARK